MQITLLVDKHDCISTSRIKTTTASKSWVAAKAVPILIKDEKMGAKQLQRKLEDDYNITVGYDTVWKGREMALKQIYGSWEVSFHTLYSWKAEIEKVSPGSVVEIDTEVVQGRVYFRRFFFVHWPLALRDSRLVVDHTYPLMGLHIMEGGMVI